MTTSPSLLGFPLIVVADECRDTTWSLREVLHLAGFPVLEAHTGPAALAAAVEMNARVLITEVRLPGFDGFELTRRLRERGKRVLIVAVTGRGTVECRARCKALRMLYMLKPSDPARVVRLLQWWQRLQTGEPTLCTGTDPLNSGILPAMHGIKTSTSGIMVTPRPLMIDSLHGGNEPQSAMTSTACDGEQDDERG